MTDLSRLFNPKTIAVVGGRECERVVEQCDKLGFDGTIWPVHPRRDEIGGRACFRSIEDLPGVPDAAYVAVNRERTISVVAALAASGCGGAVCYAAGFAEADEESAGSGDLQRQLVEAAGDMPIIGPNCYGFINASNGVALWPDQHGVQRCDSGVAIITQSSNIAINLTMQKRGLPIAGVMTVGNQAQTGLSEIAYGLLEEEKTTALGLHIEGLDDVKAFERLSLRARELGKPVVAFKVGKSEQARAATLTHTASLAGSEAAHQALFKRLGIAQVHSLEAFIETLKLFHAGGPLSGFSLLSLSCSGGEAALMADAAEGRAVHYRPFEPMQAASVKAQLGDIITIANPLDYNTFIWGDWPGMTRMFEAALAPGFDLALLVLDFPRADQCDPDDWTHALESFCTAVRHKNARAAVLASLPECMPEDVAINLLQKGIAPLCGIETALEAAEAAACAGEVWLRPPAQPLLPVASGAGADRQTDEKNIIMLDEAAAKAELAACGLVVPKSAVVEDSATIEAAHNSMTPPFALKALGLAHKSDVGGVMLDLNAVSEIEKAMTAMTSLADCFLLEEMAAQPQAELIVGISRDPVVGLMMTIGAGGVLAELLDDTATLLLPASETEIRQALLTIRVGRLLEGYRDTQAADLDALIANIICIANYACANADTLEELDVNPLFATQFGSIAVDALIVKRTR